MERLFELDDNDETALLHLAADRLAGEPEPDGHDAEAVRDHVHRSRAARLDAFELERAADEAKYEAYLTDVQRRRIERAAASAIRRAEIATRKAAGGYYANQQRTPNRPTHVEVDDVAWAAVKQAAIRRGTTVAAAVGDLVANASRASLVATLIIDRTSTGRRAQRFARLFIDDEAWFAFRAMCDEAAVTTARGVGLVVEREARKLADG
jgi:hypothetical protein